MRKNFHFSPCIIAVPYEKGTLNLQKILKKLGIFGNNAYLCTQYDLPRFPLAQRTRGGLRVFKCKNEPQTKKRCRMASHV